MQIVFHIGAHCTDDGQILTCLLRNKGMLSEEGIIVPHPGRFRPILRETLTALQGEPASPEAQEVLLDSILTEDHVERVILSNDTFICGVQRVLDRETLYPDIADKVQRLFNLFPDKQVEFCMAIRNPATFLPACFAKIGAPDFEAFIAHVDPMDLRWSDVVTRVREALPHVPLKIWSNEDTPFIWHELIREISDFDDIKRFRGLDDYISSIMTEEGVERMADYLKGHPPANEIQRRRILSAFLDKFEITEEVPDLNSARWTADYVSALTDLYEEDLFAIERMQGVQFISP
jgi:hypothetical protein